MSILIKALMPFAAFLLAILMARAAIDLLKPMLPVLCPLVVIAALVGLYVAWQRRSW